MMEVTNVHHLRLNKSKSLTINLHHVLSTVTMDDPANLGVTIQRTINVITNSIESFRDLLAVNDGDIYTSVKDTNSVNNARAAGQIIFISNNITQGFK